jgi:hypothetical protein
MLTPISRMRAMGIPIEEFRARVNRSNGRVYGAERA